MSAQEPWGIGTPRKGEDADVVTLQELAVSNAYKIAALVALLERESLLTQQEVLEGIARMKQGRGCGR